jgi:protein FAM50
MARETDRNRTGADRFVGKSDSMEESLKMQTVGLVKLEDFQQKRQALEEEKMREAARSNELKSVILKHTV